VRKAICCGHAQVGSRGQPHPGTADGRAEQCADDEEDRAAQLDAGLTAADLGDGQEEEQYDGDDDEDAERLELSQQVRLSALLDRAGDLLHLGGSLAGAQDRLDQCGREAECDERNHRGDDHVGQVHAGQGQLATIEGEGRPGHSLSSCTNQYV
jgi:hypothetical protein